MSDPFLGAGPPPTTRSHSLTAQQRELYFPNGAVVRAFPLFEIELSSAFVRLGYGQPNEGLKPSKPKVRDSKTAKMQQLRHKDSMLKRNRWKPLGHLLGKRTMRFGLLLTRYDHLYPLSDRLLEEELFLPTDAVSTRLHFLGNAEVSIAQFEDLLLFHASLFFLLYGSNTLANDKTPAWTRFRSSLDYSVIAIPISSSTPNITPTLPIRRDWTASMTRSMAESPEEFGFDSSVTSIEENEEDLDVSDSAPSSNDETVGLLKTNYAISFIDFERLDTFLSSRESEPYDELKHLPSSILRSSYNDSWYTLVDRLPGEGLDSILTFNGQTMPLKDFMADKWNLTALKPTRALLLAVPLTFKIKLAMNAFPSATKYILASATHGDEEYDEPPSPVGQLPSYQLLVGKKDGLNAIGKDKEEERKQGEAITEKQIETPNQLNQAASSSAGSQSQKIDKTGRRLIPETVRVLPVTLYDLNVASYLPSIIIALQRRLCGYALHNEIVKECCEDWEKMEPCTIATMEEALTCSSASHLRNYERLETLGDTALKYAISWYLFLTVPKEGEGALSEKKLKYISNKDLSKTAQSARIARECIPDQLSLAVKKRRCKAKHPLSMKTTADLCESILGHFFYLWGEKGIRIFLRWLNPAHRELVDEATKELDTLTPIYWKNPEEGWDEALSFPSIPHTVPMLQYRFQRRHLFAAALTHPSALHKPTQQNYERLEFLGDAALDLLIVSLLYEHPSLKPGEMSVYRSQIASNANYAFLAILLNLQTLLQHNSPSIFQDQLAYVQQLQQLLVEGDHTLVDELLCSKGLQTLKAPPALSDCFEAVAGAIFLDLGGDSVAFARVYTPLLKPLVEKYLEIDVQKFGARHPHAEFTELLQQHHCHSEIRVIEQDTSLIVWHGMIIAQIELSQNNKLDLDKQLYQMALENLSNRAYIWEESCDCQNHQ
jgi:dsRNA-specific ribonuclease